MHPYTPALTATSLFLKWKESMVCQKMTLKPLISEYYRPYILGQELVTFGKLCFVNMLLSFWLEPHSQPNSLLYWLSCTGLHIAVILRVMQQDQIQEVEGQMPVPLWLSLLLMFMNIESIICLYLDQCMICLFSLCLWHIYFSLSSSWIGVICIGKLQKRIIQQAQHTACVYSICLACLSDFD